MRVSPLPSFLPPCIFDHCSVVHTGAAAARLREERERQVEALKDRLRPPLKKLLKAKSHEKASEAHQTFLEAKKAAEGQERQAGLLKAAMDELRRELDFTQDGLRSMMMQIMMDDLGKAAMKDPEKGPEKIDKIKELLCRGCVDEESKKECEAWAEVAKAGETWHDRRCDMCNMKAQQGRKLLVCAGCQAVRYCSRECQKADWKAGRKCLPLLCLYVCLSLCLCLCLRLSVCLSLILSLSLSLSLS